MASLEHDDDSRRFLVRFRYAGREYKRSLKTCDRREAVSILGRIQETITLIERGRMTMPHDVDPATFILSDGKRKGKQDTPKPIFDSCPLGDRPPSAIFPRILHISGCRNAIT